MDIVDDYEDALRRILALARSPHLFYDPRLSLEAIASIARHAIERQSIDR
jgi:hypothetical protein